MMYRSGTIRRWLRPLKIGAAALCCVALSACSPAKKTSSQLHQIIDSGELVVGTTYSDLTYFHGANGPEGLEYELASKFADYLGVELKIRPAFSLTQMLNDLQAGRVDMLAAGLTMTPQRKQDYLFSPAYKWVSQKVVYRNGRKRPRHLGELDGTLMVVRGSSHVEALEAATGEYPELEWSETSDFEAEELMNKVLEGDIDFTVVDSSQLDRFRRYRPELSVAFTLVKEEPLAWMIDKQRDDSVQAAMIEFFGQMQQTGFIASLDEKYFGHLRNFDFVDTRAFLRAAKTKLPKYKELFKKHAGDLDWRLLAAASYQESHWNPRAVSPTGVRGLMMLTQNTARQLGIENRLDPEQSIMGGAEYLQHLLNRVPKGVRPHERVWFALAAYNVGLGHVIDASRIADKLDKDGKRWSVVKDHLPLLRQKKWYKWTRYGYARGDEPVKYVDNIRRYYDALVWLDNEQATQRAIAIQKQQFEKLATTTVAPIETADNLQDEEIGIQPDQITDPK